MSEPGVDWTQMDTDWTARDEFNFWLGQLTWGGKWEWIVYRIRGWFIAPAPHDDRCFMGSVVSASMWCPRYRTTGQIWCQRHAVDS